ncbi:MAG: 5-(carboxyamino)imidazole ribonucleotide synthase [Vulcanococcus sp.]
MGASLEPSQAAIGIVGGGQLAWMLAQAARRQGVELHVQTPSPSDPAAGLATSLVQAPVRDAEGTRLLAGRCRAVSFENEWVDLEGLAPLAAAGVCFVPALEALRPLVCKRSQRELLQRLHLPSPRWFALEQVQQELEEAQRRAAAEADDPAEPAARAPGAGATPPAPPRPRLPEGFRFPVMAKAASGGYDGRGTAVLQHDDDLEALLRRVDPSAWIVEEFVAFEQELAVVAARDAAGEVVLFPLVQTHQHAQVCDWVLAPVEPNHALQQAVRNIAASLLTSLGYVGVMAIEFFYGPAGLMVNEIAPRTHNSGHYTIEACSLSQFDQQLRLVAGARAEEPQLQAAGALMVNLLGFEQRAVAEGGEEFYAGHRQALNDLPHAHLHWYGKQGSSIGRKLGHVTLLLQAPDPQARRAEAMQRLEEVRRIWPLPPAQGSETAGGA